MKVNEVIEGAEKFLNMQVEIQGVLLLHGEVGYMVQCGDEISDIDDSLLIDVPNLKEILLPRVPALGGGRYLYCHEAKVVGRLKQEPSRQPPFKVCEVQHLELQALDESFLAIP